MLFTLYIFIASNKGNTFGKNVFSRLCLRKMYSNIERCVFRRVSQWDTLFLRRLK